MENIEQQKGLLNQWYRAIHTAHVRHGLAGELYAKRNRQLGFAVVFLTSIVGTSIFTVLSNSEATLPRIIVGVISVASTVIAALQTYLNYAELADRHTHSAAQFGALRRQFDMFWAKPQSAQSVELFMQSIKVGWDQAETDAPVVPPPIFNKAKKFVVHQDFDIIFISDEVN